jgi:hypothetical protein
VKKLHNCLRHVAHLPEQGLRLSYSHLATIYTTRTHQPTYLHCMQRFIIVLILAGLGWYGYTKYQGAAHARQDEPSSASIEQGSRVETPAQTAYRCDGRTYCSQMTSCAEATYFLKNCPGAKMDGNNDGIPCEKQWCK